ncbi:MAG: polysaccharide pyruvyl transferase family protein [Phycisphaerales bacterium]
MRKVKTVCLLGASFDTGNLGVSALAWSSIRLIMSRWPQAEVVLLGVGKKVGLSKLQIEDKKITVKTVPIRYCTNITATNHIFELLLFVLLARIGVARSNQGRSKTRDYILSADLFLDITGGDSFSDIYGMKRFIMDWLSKKLCQMTGKPFIMPPQTYGPFKKRITKWLASNILKNSIKLFSRDQQSVEEIKKLIGDKKQIEVVPDVAFVMDPVRPESEQTRQLEHLKADGFKLIGLNISGLLYNGGYTGRNEFGLKCDYKQLLNQIISYFIQQENTYVVLVPHVIPSNFEVENDLLASKKLWQTLTLEQQKRVIVLDGNYNQNQVKYLIGLCDFFMGARMHSTIAALSQSNPAVGMAYSKKFAGVFDTVGVADCVVDMRQMQEDGVIARIKTLFAEKEQFRRRLSSIIPDVKKRILQLLNEI